MPWLAGLRFNLIRFLLTMTEGWAARSAREARKVEAKKSIVSFEARVGPVPTLMACMMINLIVVMTMVNMMMTMNMTRTMVSTFLRIAAPRLCTVL